MKKLLIAVVTVLSLTGTAFASTDVNVKPSNTCGMDFARSILNQVPRTYCWLKQDLGNITFFGKLNQACSGSECKKVNNIFGL